MAHWLPGAALGRLAPATRAPQARRDPWPCYGSKLCPAALPPIAPGIALGATGGPAHCAGPARAHSPTLRWAAAIPPLPDVNPGAGLPLARPRLWAAAPPVPALRSSHSPTSPLPPRPNPARHLAESRVPPEPRIRPSWRPRNPFFPFSLAPHHKRLHLVSDILGRQQRWANLLIHWRGERRELGAGCLGGREARPWRLWKGDETTHAVAGQRVGGSGRRRLSSQRLAGLRVPARVGAGPCAEATNPSSLAPQARWLGSPAFLTHLAPPKSAALEEHGPTCTGEEKARGNRWKGTISLPGASLGHAPGERFFSATLWKSQNYTVPWPVERGEREKRWVGDRERLLAQGRSFNELCPRPPPF